MKLVAVRQDAPSWQVRIANDASFPNGTTWGHRMHPEASHVLRASSHPRKQSLARVHYHAHHAGAKWGPARVFRLSHPLTLSVALSP